MLSKILTKRSELKKAVKEAVKEETKVKTREALVKDFYNHSAEILNANNQIETDLYIQNNVKRGLRNSNGTGVVVGLTRIGDVRGYTVDENNLCVSVVHVIYGKRNLPQVLSNR